MAFSMFVTPSTSSVCLLYCGCRVPYSYVLYHNPCQTVCSILCWTLLFYETPLRAHCTSQNEEGCAQWHLYVRFLDLRFARILGFEPANLGTKGQQATSRPPKPLRCTAIVSPRWLNPLNAKLNPICHLLALLGAYHILHVSRIRVNLSLI